MKTLYPMLAKRKSIRKFDPKLKLTDEKLNNIKLQLDKLTPLLEEIKVTFKIVKRTETTCKWGEYCLLAYSEEKDFYLLNIGYMLEQFDLYLAKYNIGACWYGFGNTKEKELNGQKFVIMIAFGQSTNEDFAASGFKRKEVNEIWENNYFLNVANAARLAPSACNFQEWFVKSDENRMDVYLIPNKIPLVKNFIAKFHEIDMGIFICFLNIALQNFKYSYELQLVKGSNIEQLNKKKGYLIAQYSIFQGEK